MTLHKFKLGRKPRKFDPRIPHVRRLQIQSLAPLPSSLDYSKGLPDDLGEFLNDRLGDCTCAAYYHARQIWTGNAEGEMITETDAQVLSLYEKACGYNPDDPATDQGGVEQDVLAYMLNFGAPVAGGVVKILGYAEVDHKNFLDLRRTIAECGAAYIGIEVPQSVMDHADDNTVAWDVKGDNTIIGGHAVILVGYDYDGFTAISWGKRYKLTNNFLGAFLEEAYGIIDQSWIASTGKTPFGMDLADLKKAMQALKHGD